MIDSVANDRKNNLEGQMSLFDIIPDENKDDYEMRMPDIGEYDKQELLNYEKEVLGVYVSGHPLEEDEALWKRYVTNKTSDFMYDDEIKVTKVSDGDKVMVGGVIEGKTVKYTKKGEMMAFLSLEDLVGAVEVIVWPSDYAKNSAYLNESSKVFIKGRVSAEEEKDAKVICEQIIPFAEMPRKIWIRFPKMDDYLNREKELKDILEESDGRDRVSIYIEETKQVKELGLNMSVRADREMMLMLTEAFGEGNVKVV